MYDREKQLSTYDRYNKSAKGRERRRRYNASPKFKEVKQAYLQSPKGRETRRRINNVRSKKD